MNLKKLIEFFRPDVRIKKIKRVYDKDGVLREEIIETNTVIDMDKIDLCFEKVDEAVKKMDEAFKDL
jgi:hypothetical protein